MKKRPLVIKLEAQMYGLRRMCNSKKKMGVVTVVASYVYLFCQDCCYRPVLLLVDMLLLPFVFAFSGLFNHTLPAFERLVPDGFALYR